MKIDAQENRWFVIKVPVPKQKDPDLEKKMAAEIPAWLHFLSNRDIFILEKVDYGSTLKS